jgi:hypothetical protein
LIKIFLALYKIYDKMIDVSIKLYTGGMFLWKTKKP